MSSPSLQHDRNGSMGDSDYLSGNLLEDDFDLNHMSSASPIKLTPPVTRKPTTKQEAATSSELLSNFETLSLRSSAGASFQSSGNGRLVIAIDYGTTFTGFAFARTYSDHADLGKIEVLVDWRRRDSQPNNQQNSQMSNLQKVPSVISFAKTPQGHVQWGADIDKDAVTMVNTKLELEPQPTRFEELDLTLHLLKGTGNLAFEHMRKLGPEPAYTWRSPTEVVTSYLTEVFECARKVIDIGQLSLTKTAIDIVVTVPVNWSYEANDSMFKAVRGAGFNKDKFPTLKDTILVSEPEAASYFTARDLHERGIEFLEPGDCFILCDAGGGTADVVSYQVKKVKPHFELEKATEPTGAKCGSALIDTAFKIWLRDTLGRERYAELDPANARQQRISPHTAETGPMRELIKRFRVRKAAYPDPAEPDIRLDLPEPLSGLTIEGRVRAGELIIYGQEMRKLMNDCVNGVIILIKDQIKKVKYDQGRRVRNVFLVGGFGASPYLQEELKKSLRLRKMELRRPDADKSVTATVQGAVTYGIEKTRHKDCRYMGAVTKSYGVLIGGRFEWLVRKGDLVLSNEKKTIQSQSFWRPARDCAKNPCEFPVYHYRARNKNDDDVPEEWQDGQHEVLQAGLVKCDFAKFFAQEPRPYPHILIPGNPNLRSPTEQVGPLTWHLQLSASSIEAALLLKGKRVAHCEIKLEADWPLSRKYSTESLSEMED